MTQLQHEVLLRMVDSSRTYNLITISVHDATKGVHVKVWNNIVKNGWVEIDNLGVRLTDEGVKCIYEYETNN